MNLRGLIDFNYPKKVSSIEEVESVDSIVTDSRQVLCLTDLFHKEAHETLAIAMNMLHGKSNSGEGGEDIDRLTIGPDGQTDVQQSSRLLQDVLVSQSDTL